MVPLLLQITLEVQEDLSLHDLISRPGPGTDGVPERSLGRSTRRVRVEHVEGLGRRKGRLGLGTSK